MCVLFICDVCIGFGFCGFWYFGGFGCFLLDFGVCCLILVRGFGFV